MMVRLRPTSIDRPPWWALLIVLVASLPWAAGCDTDTSPQPEAARQSAAPPTGATASGTSSASRGVTKPGQAPLPAARLLRAAPWPREPAWASPIDEASLPTYRIEQSLDDQTGRFAGTVTVSFLNPTDAPLGEVPLLLHPNASLELGVSPEDAGSLTVKRIERRSSKAARAEPVSFEQPRPTLVMARLATAAAPGDPLTLSIHYEGQLRKLPADANDLFAQAMGSMGTLTAGAGASDYGLLAVGDGIVTAASAYPMLAPFRDGAFDTSPPGRFGDLAYNTVARFEVRTVVPKDLEVVTNLVDAAPRALGDDRRVIASAGSFVRDFVLVAGRDLERQSEQHGDTRVSSIYRARDARGGKVALDVAVASLRSFEQRFGPYPYRELDVAEASLVGGAGGVEFSSLVLIAGMLYRRPDESSHPVALLMKLLGGSSQPEAGPPRGNSLVDVLGFGPAAEPSAAPSDTPSSAAPPAPSASSSSLAPSADDPARLMNDLLAQALEFTVAHEVAHQYFAGVVGNDSKRFPSLDEPIAQYAAALVMEDRHGQAAGQRAMDANVKLNYAMYRLLGGPDRPVLRDTTSFQTPVEYASLVYGKAPYVYVALRRKLGDERLHGAVRDIVVRHRFSMLTTEQWADALEQAAGGAASGVRPIFDRYLKQSHGDVDLGVDGSGDFLLDIIYGPRLGAQMRRSFAAMGIDPQALFRMSLGTLDDGPASGG